MGGGTFGSLNPNTMSDIQVLISPNPRRESVLIRPGAPALDVQEVGPDGTPTGKVIEAQNVLATGASRAETLRKVYGGKF